MTIPWKDKFDFIVSMCFTGCKERVPSLDAEFARVGLEPDFRLWNVVSPYERRLVDGLPNVVAAMRLAGFQNSGFGHYRAVKTAYELGKRRVLVVEDDVRFLNDLGALAETVAGAPDTGTVLFDLLRAGKDDIFQIRQWLSNTVRGRWSPAPPRPCSFACYGMDRPAMARFIGMVEQAVRGEARLRLVDHYIHDKLWNHAEFPVSVAWPLAAVQKSFSQSPSNTNMTFHRGALDGQYGWYVNLGVDLADYAL